MPHPPASRGHAGAQARFSRAAVVLAALGLFVRLAAPGLAAAAQSAPPERGELVFGMSATLSGPDQDQRRTDLSACRDGHFAGVRSLKGVAW